MSHTYGLSAMPSAPPGMEFGGMQGMGGGTARGMGGDMGGGMDDLNRDSGLIGGIFSKKEHDSIRVNFSDVDWATIVRSGGFLTQGEVRL